MILQMKKEKLDVWKFVASHLKDEDDFDAFFRDLLTPKEYHDLMERVRICHELADGKTVRQVCEEVGVASATVVRGNRVLKYGSDFVKDMFER